MTRSDDLLQSIMSPVRDLYLARVLEEISKAAEQGYDCDTDLERRGADGDLSRYGLLKLPQRHDIRAQRSARTVFYDVVDGQEMRFDRFSYTSRLGGVVKVSPFQWNALCVLFTLDRVQSDWLHLRRWYLEAFQARFDEGSPDFRGTIHAMDGPVDLADGRYQLVLDLGSAPVDVLHDLIDALTSMNAQSVELTTDRPDVSADSEMSRN